MKNEYSIECTECGNYNLQEGIIHEGLVYCKDCWEKLNQEKEK